MVALRIRIDDYDRAARQSAMANTKATHLTRERPRVSHYHVGIISSSLENDDSDDDDASLIADPYVKDSRQSDNPKRKRPARKW